MRYHVLATDYDGTLARDGRVSDSTLLALHRFVASGRKLILVTGRELPQLKSVFSALSLFHWVVPTGVNKGFWLDHALQEMKLSRHNTVGVGDAENDHAFLQLCEFSAAVSNALPAVKATVDLVLPADHGAGVEFLIDQILSDDLRSLEMRSKRPPFVIANSESGEVSLPAYGGPILVCGSSGSGKSSLANQMVDSIAAQGYQFCIVDPEGDYESFEGAVVLGGPSAAPQIEEVIHVLEQPGTNVVVCLTGVPIPDRPPFFLQLLAGLIQLRIKTGRPHWLILDEAHHLMPADWLSPSELLPENLMNVVLITVQPDLLPVSVLNRVEMLAVVGLDAEQVARNFGAATGVNPPQFPAPQLETGEFWLWKIEPPLQVTRCRGIKSHREHQRHRRKYAEGQLPPDRSFYFRGPDCSLNLRAQNLILFCQLAEGIDDVTWNFHLQNGDYGRWFQNSIKDESLAAESARIAGLTNLQASESRNLIVGAIQRDYTLAATSLLPVPGAS